VVREGAHRRGRACFDTELDVDPLQVLVHRARAGAEQARDLTVGLAGAEPAQYLGFARRQAEICGGAFGPFQAPRPRSRSR
jgi:lipase chaperone LimK